MVQVIGLGGDVGLVAASRWAAVTSSGHMVQDRETRIWRSVGCWMAWMAAMVASSRAWPGRRRCRGPGQGGELVAPGTPWKARPVRCCRPGTPGRRGVLGGTVGAEGELVRVPAQGAAHRPPAPGTGGAVRVSSSTREAVIREKTVWSWAAISGGIGRPPPSPVPVTSGRRQGAAWGAWGRRPVLCWAAAASSPAPWRPGPRHPRR